jgi:hypothetical protein
VHALGVTMLSIGVGLIGLTYVLDVLASRRRGQRPQLRRILLPTEFEGLLAVGFGLLLLGALLAGVDIWSK